MSGEKPDTFELVLHCLFVMPDYLAVEKRFDVLVLTLTLLINLVEHCEENRTLLLKTLVPQTNEDLFSPNSERKTAAEGLVQMFLEKEENAKREESKTGKYLTTLQIRAIARFFFLLNTTWALNEGFNLKINESCQICPRKLYWLCPARFLLCLK